MALNLGCSYTSAPPAQIPANAPVAPFICPEQGQIQPKLPEYSIENMAAEAPYKITIQKSSTFAVWNFFLRMYEPGSKPKEIKKLSSNDNIDAVVLNEGIKIIEIYERDSSGQPLEKPSARIFKDVSFGGRIFTYIIFELPGLEHHPDRPAEFCEDNPYLKKSAEYVFGLRMWDIINRRMKERFMPLPISPPKLPLFNEV